MIRTPYSYPYPISGQTVVLDAHGEMQPATGLPDKSGVFQVQNDYDPIRIGVNAKLGGAWSPISLSLQPFATGVISLTPVEKVLVWFDTSSSTGTMLVDAVGNGVEVGRCTSVKCCLCTDLP